MPLLKFTNNGDLIGMDAKPKDNRKGRHLDPSRSWRNTYRWQNLRKEVISDQPYCSVCGHTGSMTNPLTADHIKAVSNGGNPFHRQNCQTLCKACNSSKGVS